MHTYTEEAEVCPYCGASNASFSKARGSRKPVPEQFPWSTRSLPQIQIPPEQNQKLQSRLPGVDPYMADSATSYIYNAPAVSFEDAHSPSSGPIQFTGQFTVVRVTPPALPPEDMVVELYEEDQEEQAENIQEDQWRPSSKQPALDRGSRALTLPPARGVILQDDNEADNEQALVPQKNEEQEIIYISPGYTSQRVSIPAYRVISGLLSVVITMTLLCGMTGFLLYRNGAWASVGQWFGIAPPGSVASNSNFSNPPDRIDKGPAEGIIPSVMLSTRLQSGTVVGHENVFQLNQTIYLAYHVKSPPSNGQVIIKWYANGGLVGMPEQYAVAKSDDIQPGMTTISFSEPTQGAVEVYWNDELAQKLLFVVR